MSVAQNQPRAAAAGPGQAGSRGAGEPAGIGRHWPLLVAVALAAVVTLPATGGEPIWDDPIVFERYLPAFGSVWDAFAPPPGTGELGQNYYRPLVTLSYMADVALYGDESFVGHHVTTVAWHALAVLLLGLLATRLLGDRPAGRAGAAVVALVFAVHPVHVETVAQITGRCDSMAAVFMLGAVLAVLRAQERPAAGGRRRGLGWWLLAGGALFGGLLSKEVAMVAIAPVALALWCGPGGPAGRAAWMRFGATFGAAFAVYFALRLGAAPSSPPLLAQSVAAAAERLLGALAYDVHLLLVPWPQAAFVPPDQLPGLAFGLAALVLVGMAGVLVWRPGRGPFVLRFAWSWTVVTLAPALALVLVKASEQPVAERFLYVPSVGVALLAGHAAVCGAARWGWRPVVVVVAVVVGALAVQTGLRSTVYTTRLTFWQDTVARAPDAGLPVYQLGLELRRRGELDVALPHLRRALELYDDAEGRSRAHNTIGTIHLERREWAAAELELRAALQERPDYAIAWFNLAGVYAMRAGRPVLADVLESVDALERAVAARPAYVRARTQLGAQLYELAVLHGRAGNRGARDEVKQRALAAARWLATNGRTEAQRRQGQQLLQRVERLR